MKNKLQLLILMGLLLPLFSFGQILCPTSIDITIETDSPFSFFYSDYPKTYTLGLGENADIPATTVQSQLTGSKTRLSGAKEVCWYRLNKDPKLVIWTAYHKRYKLENKAEVDRFSCPAQNDTFTVKTSHGDGAGWKGRTYTTTKVDKYYLGITRTPFETNHHVWCESHFPKWVAVDFPRQRNDVMTNFEKTGFLRDYHDLDGNWEKVCRADCNKQVGDAISDYRGGGNIGFTGMVENCISGCISRGWESSLPK